MKYKKRLVLWCSGALVTGKRKGFTPLEIDGNTLASRIKHRKRFLSLTGFTLVELLVVIAIIAILAGILMPALGAARSRAQVARTEAMISSLRLAISMFDTDTGVIPDPLDTYILVPLPPSPAFEGYEGVLADLTTNPGAPVVGWAGPYMEFRAEDIRDSGDAATIVGVVDFWGNPFQFRNINTDLTGAPPGHRIYIWSFGLNRENERGGGDDITSW